MKTTLGCAVAAALLFTSPAFACSTCKCGDYTITLMGLERPYQHRLRASFDFVTRSESAAHHDEMETIDESRLLFGMAFGVSEDLMLALQLPVVRKELEGESGSVSGVGDIDLVGRWVLLRSGESPARHLAGLRVGVRLPTSEEVRDGSGNLHEIDLQPDAGSTAPNIGAWYSHIRFPWMVTLSATAFTFSEGNQGFQPGDALLASAQSQYALTQAFALQAGIDARQAGRNSGHHPGELDPNSGGFLAMAYAGAAVRVGVDTLLNFGVQVPVVEDLNGRQDEGANLRAGATFDF